MVVGEEEFFRMDGLTGTNLQYHLLGDLMVDDVWTTTTGESGTGIRPDRKQKCFATTAESSEQSPLLTLEKTWLHNHLNLSKFIITVLNISLQARPYKWSATKRCFSKTHLEYFAIIQPEEVLRREEHFTNRL